jgi:hypothetical protein
MQESTTHKIDQTLLPVNPALPWGYIHQDGRIDLYFDHPVEPLLGINCIPIGCFCSLQPRLPGDRFQILINFPAARMLKLKLVKF